MARCREIPTSVGVKVWSSGMPSIASLQILPHQGMSEQDGSCVEGKVPVSFCLPVPQLPAALMPHPLCFSGALFSALSCVSLEASLLTVCF